MKSRRHILAIFGTGQIAEMVAFYFQHDYGRDTRVFIVDDEFKVEDHAFGRPVLTSSEAAETLEPKQTDVFVALAYSGMNTLRREKLNWVKGLGFGTVSYVSPRATIYPNVFVGENCLILEDNTLQPFTTISDNVTLWSGNHIGHHSTIEEDAFVSSHVVISGGVRVGKGCFLGVNCTIRDHVTLGARTLVGAGVTILGDTEEESVYIAPRTSPSERRSSQIRGL